MLFSKLLAATNGRGFLNNAQVLATPFYCDLRSFFSLSLFTAYTFFLFINLILSVPGAIAVGQADQNTNISLSPTNTIVTIVLGILWLFILPIGALFCWFMPAYYAYR